jgi:hypothetical protein
MRAIAAARRGVRLTTAIIGVGNIGSTLARVASLPARDPVGDHLPTPQNA